MAEEKKTQNAPDEKVVSEKKNDKPAKKDKKDRPSVFARIKAWLRTYKSEMKKIVWSSPKQVLSNSILVLVSIIILSAVIGVLDLIFGQAIVGLTDLFG